ncbi:hypothetical protein GCM10027418_24280 [Mariniluteicoccus endophyticus]
MTIKTTEIQELIQKNIASLLVQPLEEASSFLASGVRIFDTATPISIPALTGGFSPGWVGESEEIPEETEDPFGAVSLLPSTMKSVKSLVRISNEALRQSSQALDGVISARLVTDTARVVDAQAWGDQGDGVTLPKGVLHADNVRKMLSIAAGDKALTLDHMHDALGAAMGGDVPLTGLRWVMRPETLTALRKVKDTSGKYVVTPDVTQASGVVLLGVPVTVTKRLPAGHVLLMNPSSWAVARDLNPTAKVLTERYAEFDEIGIRVVSRYDWGVLQDDANVLISGLV